MKTKITLVTLLATFCVFSITAQTTTQVRSLDSFNKLASSSGIDVVYTEGNTQEVTVEADASNIDKIETTVVDGLLSIKVKKGEKIKTNKKRQVYVTAPTLMGVSMSGGADFRSDQVSNKQTIKINASGGSDVNIKNIESDTLIINLSGGSDLSIKGLKATTFNLNASGGSDASIVVKTTILNVNASGGSDISLSGETDKININCSGGSDGFIQNLKYNTISSNKSGGSSIKK